MADISITAANVVPDSGYQYVSGVAGETLTAGQLCYLKSSDNKYWKADANLSAEGATVKGINLAGAAAGQPVRLMTAGTLTIGGTVVAGGVYVASATAGGLAPVADLASGWYTTIVCVAISATKVRLCIIVSGVTN